MKQTTRSLIGAGAVTGAAAAAAYYLYGSDRAAQHRKQLKSWARTAEREVVRKARLLKKAALTDETMRGVIAEVAKRYELTKDLDPKDVKEFIGTMQRGFREARARAGKAFASARKASATRVKTVKKTVARRSRRVLSARQKKASR